MAETEDAAWNREDQRKGEPTCSYKIEEEEKEKQVELEREMLVKAQRWGRGRNRESRGGERGTGEVNNDGTVG